MPIFNRSIVAFITVMLLSAGIAAAQTEAGQNSNEALQKQLEREFVAPCCWNEAVATHQSGASQDVKTEIATLLQQGKDRSEVRAWMVDKYGERILITPEAKGFNLLVWIGPFIMIAIGFGLVALYLRRVRPQTGAAEA